MKIYPLAILALFFYFFDCTNSIVDDPSHIEETTNNLSVNQKDTTNNGSIEKDNIPVGFISFDVFDMEEKIWLKKSWNVNADGEKIEGYKNYNSWKAYLIAGWIRLHATDSTNRYAWAVTLGNKIKENTNTVNECYIVMEYEKHLKVTSYQPTNMEYAKDTISFSEFILQDSFILYKFADERSIFCGENNIYTGIDFFSEYVMPCDGYEKFYLGKPKYKLVRKK